MNEAVAAALKIVAEAMREFAVASNAEAEASAALVAATRRRQGIETRLKAAEKDLRDALSATINQEMKA